MANIFDKLFSVDKKIMKTVEKQAKQVEALAKSMEELSDTQLENKTVEFKQRLANGETVDDIMIEAYAVVREAAKRVIGEYPYLVQIMGAIVMNNGDIAEMKTGD